MNILSSKSEVEFKRMIEKYKTLKENNDTNYELELRIGDFDPRSRRFVPGVTEEKFNLLLNDEKLFHSKSEEREITIISKSLKNNNRMISYYSPETLKRINVEYDTKERLDDYTDKELSVRLSLSKEENTNPIKETRNYFRFKNRITKTSKNKLFKYDFTKTSSIKSTIKEEIITWKNNCFSGQNIEFDYEIEIEKLPVVQTNEELFDNITEIIKNVKSTLDSNFMSNLLKNKIYPVIKDLLNKRMSKLSFSSFISKPVSLKRQDIYDLINEKYAVTAKADGTRALLYGSKNDQMVYLIEAGDKITSFPSKVKWTYIIDGEYINTKKSLFAAFDILVGNGDNITSLLLKDRLSLLAGQIKSIKIKGLKLEMKIFEFNETVNTKNIFKLSNSIYKKTKYSYDLDGIIYTPISKGYYNSDTYKWKPADKLTIDFLVKGSELEYTLYVGIRRSLFKSLTDKEKEQIGEVPKEYHQNKNYFPVPFGYSKEFRLTKKELDKILKDNNLTTINDTILELYWAKDKWNFERFREDKTRDYQLSKGNYGNDYKTAKTNWEIIGNPVTINEITGKKEINLKDIPYFQAELTNTIKPMKKFHNSIKGELYKKYAKNANLIIELAGGRYNDIHRWLKSGVKKVVVIDKDEQALEVGRDRLSQVKSEYAKVPEVTGLDYSISSKTLMKFLKKEIDLKESSADLVSCHFAIHYILSSTVEFGNFIDNVKKLLKKNGHFIFTCFNGGNLLKLFNKNDVKQNETINLFKDKEKVFSIRRLFESDTLMETGQEINVFVESLGGKYNEYVVNMDYIIPTFIENGFEVVEHVNFKKKYNNKFNMSKSEKTYSFLNDYVVLKLTSS